MSWVKTEKSNYQNIASAIRTKAGSSDTFLPSEMAAAIAALPEKIGNMTYTNLIKTETTETPSTAGEQNVSFDFGDNGEVLVLFYSCDEVGSSTSYTLNSGFMIIDKSVSAHQGRIAEVHTNPNVQAPSIQDFMGDITVNAHYSGVKTKTYRIVKIGGYFS